MRRNREEGRFLEVDRGLGHHRIKHSQSRGLEVRVTEESVDGMLHSHGSLELARQGAELLLVKLDAGSVLPDQRVNHAGEGRPGGIGHTLELALKELLLSGKGNIKGGTIILSLDCHRISSRTHGGAGGASPGYEAFRRPVIANEIPETARGDRIGVRAGIPVIPTRMHGRKESVLHGCVIVVVRQGVIAHRLRNVKDIDRILACGVDDIDGPATDSDCTAGGNKVHVGDLHSCRFDRNGRT